jgi:hypothetical protein
MAMPASPVAAAAAYQQVPGVYAGGVAGGMGGQPVMAQWAPYMQQVGGPPAVDSVG